MTEKIIRFHFLVSVLLEIALGLIVVVEPTLLFSMDAYYPDPLRNNLLIIVGYMTVLELILIATRYPNGGYWEALLTGILLLLIAVGVPVYSSLNHIDVRPEVVYCAAYFTVAHALYYVTGTGTSEQEKANNHTDAG